MKRSSDQQDFDIRGTDCDDDVCLFVSLSTSAMCLNLDSRIGAKRKGIVVGSDPRSLHVNFTTAKSDASVCIRRWMPIPCSRVFPADREQVSLESPAGNV